MQFISLIGFFGIITIRRFFHSLVLAICWFLIISAWWIFWALFAVVYYTTCTHDWLFWGAFCEVFVEGFWLIFRGGFWLIIAGLTAIVVAGFGGAVGAAMGIASCGYLFVFRAFSTCPNIAVAGELELQLKFSIFFNFLVMTLSFCWIVNISTFELILITSDLPAINWSIWSIIDSIWGFSVKAYASNRTDLAACSLAFDFCRFILGEKNGISSNWLDFRFFIGFWLVDRGDGWNVNFDSIDLIDLINSTDLSD